MNRLIRKSDKNPIKRNVGEFAFMLKDFGMIWIKETDINTPEAKLIKYATLRFAQDSNLLIVKMPIVVIRQANKLVVITAKTIGFIIHSPVQKTNPILPILNA